MRSTVDNRARDLADEQPSAARSGHALSMLLTVDEAATLLRTTRRAIYAMIERRQLAGVIRIRRRVLFRADALLHWLDQKRAPSPEEGTAMSVTLRPYRSGGWEVDITIRLHDGSQYRERKTRVPLLEIGGAPMGAGS